jgi:hypothetical protein
MGNSHEELLEDLDRQLDSALASTDEDEVKQLLVEIGKVELRAKASKKPKPASPSINGDTPL